MIPTPLHVFVERLNARSGVRVRLDAVREDYKYSHPGALADPEQDRSMLAVLRDLHALGRISLPASGSWSKVGNPRLPLFVNVVREVAACMVMPDHAWCEELGFLWNAPPRTDGWATALALDAFFKAQHAAHAMPLVPIPVKERSLQIFGDEKRLDGLRTGTSLFGGRLPLTTLGAYLVPIPLSFRGCVTGRGRPVLVVENHTTYHTLDRWNQQHARYAAVVYGQGSAFTGPDAGLALQEVLDLVGGIGAFYFGDLDPEGVRIPMRFNAARTPGEVTVQPDEGLYASLLAIGVSRALDDGASKLVPQTLTNGWLPASLLPCVERLWSLGQWLPQEGVGMIALANGILR